MAKEPFTLPRPPQKHVHAFFLVPDFRDAAISVFSFRRFSLGQNLGTDPLEVSLAVFWALCFGRVPLGQALASEGFSARLQNHSFWN